MGLTRIALDAGVSYSGLYQLLNGLPWRNIAPTRTVQVSTAVRVLAVEYRGDPCLVDAVQVRNHVQSLMAAGLSRYRICVLSGVSKQAVYDLLHGNRRTGRPTMRVSVMTERRLLSVTADLGSFPDRAQVDGTVTRRKLEALIAIGWDAARLGRDLGIERQHVWLMLTRPTVMARRARQVRDLYERLWNTPPATDSPQERWAFAVALRTAEDNGYRKPMDWVDIDDEAEQPVDVDPDYIDEVAVRRVLDGAMSGVVLTRAEKKEVVRRLVKRGVTVKGAAGRVSLSLRYAEEAVA
jgi:hypothetical protein